MGGWLDRALAAEEQLESARARIEELESLARGVLGNDPEVSTRASAWVQRAECAERLLQELSAYLGENPSLRELLPTGFADRLAAQLHTLRIIVRDQKALGEKPKPGEWWDEHNPVIPANSEELRRATKSNGWTQVLGRGVLFGAGGAPRP